MCGLQNLGWHWGQLGQVQGHSQSCGRMLQREGQALEDAPLPLPWRLVSLLSWRCSHAHAEIRRASRRLRGPCTHANVTTQSQSDLSNTEIRCWLAHHQTADRKKPCFGSVTYPVWQKGCSRHSQRLHGANQEAVLPNRCRNTECQLCGAFCTRALTTGLFSLAASILSLAAWLCMQECCI